MSPDSAFFWPVVEWLPEGTTILEEFAPDWYKVAFPTGEAFLNADGTITPILRIESVYNPWRVHPTWSMAHENVYLPRARKWLDRKRAIPTEPGLYRFYGFFPRTYATAEAETTVVERHYLGQYRVTRTDTFLGYRYNEIMYFRVEFERGEPWRVRPVRVDR